MGRPPKSVKSYIDTIWTTVVSPCIRLLGCLESTGKPYEGKCYTCGKLQTYGQLQAGHWRGRSNLNTIFELDNLRIQCSVCNDWRKGNGMRPVFEKNLRDEIGNKRVDRIFALSLKPKQWTIEELVKIKDEYQKMLNELREKI